MTTACDCGSPVCNECQSREALADLQRMAQEQEAHNADALLRLRALRLWHYRAMLVARANARSTGFEVEVRRYDELANVHLGFVQSLNDWFAIDDTAFRDAAK